MPFRNWRATRIRDDTAHAPVRTPDAARAPVPRFMAGRGNIGARFYGRELSRWRVW